jgi:hypothetical protein
MPTGDDAMPDEAMHDAIATDAMTRKGETLAESAGRIADGRAGDWDEALRSTPELAHERESLERVARIAEAWRALGVTPPDDDDVGEAALFAWGDLEAREKLGEGTFGEVWRAWDPSLQREVALKLRRGAGDDAMARRELDEARRLARVRHLNVLTIHGVDVREGRAGLWTDLVRGRTLEQLLNERGTLGADEAAVIGLELCRALAAVHAAGLVHGDLKASNVMREDGGRIVLMDFGSVSEHRGDAFGAMGAFGASGSGSSRTGTPLSAAPETLQGQPASPASDVYALGALLFRLVTGRHPVRATNLEDLRAKHARGERESLRAARPDLATGFVTAIERALAPTPQARFADAGAFEQALAATLAPGAPAPAPGLGDSARERSWPRWLPAVAVVAALSVLGAWALFAPRKGEPGAPAPLSVGAVPTARIVAESTAHPTMLEQAPSAEVWFWRARDEQRQLLETGSAISPGDHLYLEYRGAEPLFVYVLDEDDHGETYTLFPVAGSDLSNPLRAHEKLRLPGRRDGQAFDWLTTSAGGHEQVLIVASRKRVPTLEQLVAAIPAADPGHPVAYARVPDEAMASLRGIGGMAPAPAREPRESRLAALARELAARHAPGVWLRSLELENR